MVIPKATDRELREARERIARWRAEGPARFAVEALGIPEKWNPVEKRGVLGWWWEASKHLVVTRRLTIRSGHGVGKSAFLAISILWFMICYFPCKIPCTAPTAHQLSDVLWAELAKWHRILTEASPALGELFEWTTDEFRLKEAPKESFAVARTARQEKPEALQGFHSDNLLIEADEASGIADVIFEVGQGSLSSDGSFVILTGNPTRREGFFFRTHTELRDRWAVMHVSGEDGELVDAQFRDDMAHQYGKDSNVYRVRVKGDFPTTEDDVVIPLDLLEAAAMREVTAHGKPVWGVDVARFGGDRTVLVKRVTNATLEKHKSWSGVDTMQTAGRVYAEWLDTPPEDRPESVFVDVIGIGAGVADRLQELGMPAIGVNVAESASIDDRYARLRDELWFNARRWFERKNCKLVDDPTLIAELSLPRYGFTSSGKLKVESKDDLKKRYPRSPDVADALVLTFGQVAEHKGRQSYEPESFEDF